jgi:hypothetical protein
MPCVGSGWWIESRSIWLETSRCPHCGAVVSIESLGKLSGHADKFVYRFKSHEHRERTPGLRASYSLVVTNFLPEGHFERLAH